MGSIFRAGYAIRNQDRTHFLTSTVVEWIELFIRPQLADIIVDSLNFCAQNKNLHIHAWCLMPNHLHLLVTQPDGKLSDTLRDFKRHTSSTIIAALQESTVTESRKRWLLNRLQFAGVPKGQPFKLWQDGNHPIECAEREFFDQRFLYIHENPVKAGFVWQPEHYRYSSAIDYMGGKGLVQLVKD